MLLSVHNHACATHVATTSDHHNVAGVKFDQVGELAGLDLVLDGVVHTDERIGVTDGATIMCYDVGDSTRTESDLFHLQKLVCSLFGSDTVDDEATLYVVENAEVLAGLFDRDNV